MGWSQLLGQRGVAWRPCHNYHLEKFLNKSSVAQNVHNLFIQVPYNRIKLSLGQTVWSYSASFSSPSCTDLAEVQGGVAH